MALPLLLPAAIGAAEAATGVLAGSAALAALIEASRQNRLSPLPLSTDKWNEFKSKYDANYGQQSKPLVLPKEPLVLAPEYRTESLVKPTQLPFFVSKTLTDSAGQSYEIPDAIAKEYATPAPSPKPKGNNDDEDENQKSEQSQSAFKQGLNKGWKHTKKIGSVLGKGLGYVISGVLPLGVAAGAGYGLYKLFSNDENEDTEIRVIE